MALISWKDSYNLEIQEIDNQHRGLVELINKLHEAMKEKKTQKALGSIIDEMVSYTKTHFKTEEDYFKKFGYKETAAHKEEHRDFVAKVLEFSKDFENGKVMLSIDIINFLRNWLIDHILGSDTKYISLFKRKGLS